MIVLLGRPISRLMFDVYLFGGAALILSDFIRYKGMTIKVLSLQAIGVLLLSLYSVYALSPGIISDESRDQVLFDNASGYSASRELNKLLPPNSVLLTDIRSKSLLPGKVILADAFQYATSVDDVNRIVLSENISNHITHVALKAMDRDIYSSIFECANKDTKRIIKVSRATRNPFNESSYSFVFFEINRDKKCFLNNA